MTAALDQAASSSQPGTSATKVSPWWTRLSASSATAIFAVGPPPSAATAADRAVHAEIARGKSFHEVLHNRDIQSMLTHEEAHLRRQGFLRRLVPRKWLFLIATATVAVSIAVFSVLLYVAEVPVWEGEPTMWGGAVLSGAYGIPFILLTIALLGHTDRRSRAGRNALRVAWQRYPMSETVAPGRWLGRPISAGMVAATEGVAPIWKADPRFADQAGLPEVRRSQSDGDGGEGGEGGYDGGSDDGTDGD